MVNLLIQFVYSADNSPLGANQKPNDSLCAAFGDRGGEKKSFNRNKPNSRTRLGEGDHLPQPVGVRVKQREGKEEHRETTNDTIGSTLQVGGTSNKLWSRYHPRLSLLVHPCKNISFRPFNYRS